MRITPRLSGLFIVSVSCNATHRGGASLLYDIGTTLKPQVEFFDFYAIFLYLLCFYYLICSIWILRVA